MKPARARRPRPPRPAPERPLEVRLTINRGEDPRALAAIDRLFDELLLGAPPRPR